MTYLAHLKTMLVEAIKTTFDDQYPESDFQGVHASIEYPVEQANYPGIWVDYDNAQPLRVAGIDHKEALLDENGEETTQKITRWRFQGYASFTITALSSWERDRLYDELVRVLAFGKEAPTTARFREFIENNDFIAANFDFDEIEDRGNTAAPGTPWGTDEIIYERTVNMEVLGEFVSNDLTGDLALLSRIIILPFVAMPGEEPELPAEPPEWHYA